MKQIVIGLLLSLGTVAFAAESKHVFAGSDTLAGVVSDAIIAAGLDQKIQYAGGGSGNGEKGLVAGDQGIAPMSREMKPEMIQALTDKGSKAVPHVIALDGLSVFVNVNNALPSLDLATIVRIYTCEFTKWEQVPGSPLKGIIKVYRRNDTSGTTDAFKHFTGIKSFGACVVAVNETADIADVTSREAMALGYSGLSGKVAGNRYVAVAAKAGAKAVLPTTATIRDFSYPMARNLYIYEVTGALKANAAELELLESVTDRSFMDPIVQAHEFVTID